MSWDDLVSMASRGLLGRSEKVKQGTEADWVQAGSIEGLFVSSLQPATVENHADHAAEWHDGPVWYCDVLGSELGPFPWAELLEMAQCGELTRTQSVRQANEPTWRRAEQVPGLFAGPASTYETDFDVDISSPASAAIPGRQTEHEEDDGADETGPNSRADTANSNASIAASGPAAEDARQAAPRTVVSAPSPATASPEAVKRIETKEKPEKRARDKTAKPTARVGLNEERKRALLGTIGIVSLAGMAYVAYLGIVAIASMRSVNYGETLAGYDQLFQQAKQAQTDSTIASDPGSGTKFLAKINELRGPLQKARPGSTDAQLFEASTMLVELFASAAAPPGSEAAKERSETEEKYLSKIAEIRTALGDAN